MNLIISMTQLVKDRSIINNTILMIEVLHSFISVACHERSFTLKANIHKAFDMLEWFFVAHALTTIGVPPSLVALINSCLTVSKLTIMVNGQESGFLKPMRGLRQGCPLFSYLFIISMEFLSKAFHKALTEGG
jgi:Reverse transcriptase (RNA-dependent DNA polymerase)